MRLSAGSLHDLLAVDIKAIINRMPRGDADHVLAGGREPVGGRVAPFIIDADDHRSGVRHAGQESLLHGSIITDRAMAVDVIFAQIDPHANRRIERRREVDLIGRALDHICAPGPGRLERQDRCADIAAKLNIHAGCRQDVRDQGRGGGLSVGTRDGDEARVRSMQAALAAEQLDVADDFDARPARELRCPMWDWMSERHARTEYQRGNLLPVDLVQIRGRNAGVISLEHSLGAVIERHDIGATGQQRAGAGFARAAEPEQRDFAACKRRNRDHCCRSARVIAISELPVRPWQAPWR